MTKLLEGKVALVTGGGGGIGRGISERFATHGATVVVADVDEPRGRATADHIAERGGRAEAHVVDVTDPSQVADLAATLGSVDLLVNNVGHYLHRPVDFVETSEPEWDALYRVNLKHVFFAAQAVVPQMQARGGGSIINMSSVAWIRGAPALPAYAAAKAAIVGFTNSLARLVGTDRIRVNAIAPGMVITERQRRLWFTDEQQIAEFRARQAIPDAVTPGDIARLALFLASDESQRITRQCFQVDGGLG